jgi:hypothetical protein
MPYIPMVETMIFTALFNKARIMYKRREVLGAVSPLVKRVNLPVRLAGQGP